MIERKFVSEKLKEFQVQKFISEKVGKGKYSYFELKKTPLGEKIVIYTSRPGLIVGKKGETIRALTMHLKQRFKMENPQIEVEEVRNPDLDGQTIAEQIVNVLERFGPKRFKSVGYKTLQRIIDAGALGAEIVIGGRGVPSARARSWRFYAGYLKKSGDIAMSKLSKGLSVANLKSGSIGIKVKIMTPDIELPDKMVVKEPEPVINIEEIKEEALPIEGEKAEESKEEKVEEKKPVKKAPTKKKEEKAPKEDSPKEKKEKEKSKEKKVTKKKVTKKKVVKKKVTKKEEPVEDVEKDEEVKKE